MFSILKSKGYNRAWKEQIGFKEVNAGDRGILPGKAIWENAEEWVGTVCT